jgi:anti-sigma factor RsiW
MRDMPCQELVEVVTDYLEGALAAQERRRFEAHLAACDACRDYVEQMHRTIATVGKVDVDSLSDGARQALLETFRGWRAA